MKWSELLPGDCYFSVDTRINNNSICLVITQPRGDGMIKWYALNSNGSVITDKAAWNAIIAFGAWNVIRLGVSIVRL